MKVDSAGFSGEKSPPRDYKWYTMWRDDLDLEEQGDIWKSQLLDPTETLDLGGGENPLILVFSLIPLPFAVGRSVSQSVQPLG